jgi:hypothetical protein
MALGGQPRPALASPSCGGGGLPGRSDGRTEQAARTSPLEHHLLNSKWFPAGRDHAGKRASGRARNVLAATRAPSYLIAIFSVLGSCLCARVFVPACLAAYRCKTTAMNELLVSVCMTRAELR